MALWNRSFAALLFCAATTNAKLSPADRTALVWLYDNLGGSSWTNNSNWGEADKDPCTKGEKWYGVGCYDPCNKYRDGASCYAGRVTSVNLRLNNLEGDITGWSGIGVLSNISYLDLSHNTISGSIPAEIGDMDNIEVIRFEHNSMTGELPSELGNVNENLYSAITEMNFGFNSHTGQIPTEVALNAALKIFDASFNNLAGTLPADIYTDGNWDSIQSIRLQFNQISGTIAEEIATLGDTLRYLHLQNNTLTGVLPDGLGGLVVLDEFLAFENKLTGQIPTEIGTMANLRRFEVQDNELVGTIPTEVGNLLRLTAFDTFNNLMGNMNNLNSPFPTEMFQLQNLQYFYLQNEHLETLRVNYCNVRFPEVLKFNWVQLIKNQRKFLKRYDQKYSVATQNNEQLVQFVPNEFLCPTGILFDTHYAFNSLTDTTYPDQAEPMLEIGFGYRNEGVVDGPDGGSG